MTACEDRLAMLHALLDDELDAVHASALEAHLKTCVGCAEELERQRTLRALLGNPAMRHEAPAGLRSRIQEALPREKPAAPSRFAWAALGAGIAAAASLTLTLVQPPPRGADIEQQLVGSHVRSLLANHLVDVVTSNQHVVKPWFNGRIDFSPPTPDLAAQGFPLAGGRLDYIEGRVVPAIVYRRRLHTINLFAWPQGKGPSFTTAHFDGYTIRHWQKGGLDFWAVSDVAEADLDTFQRAFVAATP
ncbi:MAG: anti-sigma factor [Sphingomonas bacterium]|uniref:anti-sigma factor family protein n=1 Tax=Sphingomonas bacterium TaxID=1895847 RepID=UPI0026023B6A|nr:anti-sigma factor [Sphingomonas bacterium]MDB5703976.1 anti-sigma factor [Sphingomonas bacterium]